MGQNEKYKKKKKKIAFEGHLFCSNSLVFSKLISLISEPPFFYYQIWINFLPYNRFQSLFAVINNNDIILTEVKAINKKL